MRGRLPRGPARLPPLRPGPILPRRRPRHRSQEPVPPFGWQRLQRRVELNRRANASGGACPDGRRLSVRRHVEMRADQLLKLLLVVRRQDPRWHEGWSLGRAVRFALLHGAALLEGSTENALTLRQANAHPPPTSSSENVAFHPTRPHIRGAFLRDPIQRGGPRVRRPPVLHAHILPERDRSHTNRPIDCPRAKWL